MAQDYDVTLKTIFKTSSLAEQICGGAPVVRWLDGELPRTVISRADLIGETADGSLIHLEFQSANSIAMGVRMASYYMAIRERLHRFPHQVVIYVGRERLRMNGLLETGAMQFRYKVVDLREIDAEPFLASGHIANQILAVLMRLKDRKAAIRGIVANIGEQRPEQRSAALNQLLILSGLRGLENEVEREIRHMPILESLLDHEVLGREFKKGQEQGRTEGHIEGRTEGRTEGRVEGHTEGELAVLRLLLLDRFHTIPEWAEERLKAASTLQLETWVRRLMQATTLDEVFGPE